VTSPGVGFSSEVAAYPFLMLDFHQLATTSFARRARVIRVPRCDGCAGSYAVAGIAKLCNLWGDLSANNSSSCISRFFIIFDPEVSYPLSYFIFIRLVLFSKNFF
ncbi:MAG: hypothetical protein J5U19_02305, partial [Candidatus Methanoperedens sp.]|nr:hypothetical protein [Candidatus Methanoperedens sp.]